MMSGSSNRNEKVFMAKLAEHAERYEDIVTIMRDVARSADELTDQERNLLAIGYKNVVNNLRTAWRAVATFEQEQINKKVKETRSPLEDLNPSSLSPLQTSRALKTCRL